MKIDNYLRSTNTSSRQLATRLRVSISAVRKWRQELRTPRKPMVKKIVDATKGQVKYEDWY